MKKGINFKETGLFMFIVLLACALFGIDSGIMAADVVTGAGGGVTETAQVQSTQWVKANAEDLMLNDIERKVVKIRPMGNPLEQIARYATKRSATSMVQEYYATDVLPIKTTVKTTYTEEAVTGVSDITLDTNNNAIFSKYETIMFPGVLGWEEGGTVQSDEYLIAYVTGKASDKKLELTVVNGKKIGTNLNSFPTLASAKEIIRMGRAHNEFDMQTTPFAKAPTKFTQYLQIFKAQIEETTLAAIQSQNQEADWGFSDIEEEAIFDMKRGMNKNFMVGSKRKIYDTESKEVYLTGGIWWQAKGEFVYGDGTDNQITFDELVQMTQKAFTGNAGNKEKVFLVGSDLMTNLSLIDYSQTQKPAATTVVKYGITFKEITTNFGTLWVIHDESMDECGMSKNGLIIDPTFLRKYAIKELSTFDLDKRKSGESDADARTITEISGLVLQNQEAHIRVAPHA